jgi:hypothetical protein
MSSSSSIIRLKMPSLIGASSQFSGTSAPCLSRIHFRVLPPGRALTDILSISRLPFSSSRALAWLTLRATTPQKCMYAALPRPALGATGVGFRL